jgi:hypothetical protein
MAFEKGHISWNTGKKMPAYVGENLRLNHSGKNHPFYGRHHSIETKKLLSSLRKGKKRGYENSHWKGGRKINAAGYVHIYCPCHPCATNGTYVFEHRLIMENKLKRFLRCEEIVHHINGIKDDNRLCNLILFRNNKEHSDFHAMKKRLEKMEALNHD